MKKLGRTVVENKEELQEHTTKLRKIISDIQLSTCNVNESKKALF